MPLITSVMESMVSDPYARLYMRDVILGYLVPDYRPVYNAVVRDLNWLGPELSEGKIGSLLESLDMDAENVDFYEYLPPKSYFWDYHWVLHEINHKTRSNRRFQQRARRR